MPNQFNGSFDPDEPDDAHAFYGAREPHEPHYNPFPRSSAGTPLMTPPPCPKCQSVRIETRNQARKVGGAIGTVAGAVSGAAVVLSGAEMGATVGLVAGPFGAMLGGIAGAVLGALVGGTAGCAAGAALGEMVDDKVLNNYRCLACGYTYNSKLP